MSGVYERARTVSWRRTWSCALAVSLCLAGCEEEPGGDLVDGFTEAEWAKIRELSPLPEPEEDPTNAYADDVDAAALGQKLFFDRRFSGHSTPYSFRGYAACSDCWARKVSEWMSRLFGVSSRTAYP